MAFKIWEIIKYEGNNNTLVWKHEAEDFNTHSTLIVQEPMEAIFFSNGQVADLFPAGKYVLETGNIPVLRKLLQIPTGGVSPFHCQIYFVNKVEIMALRWGTDSKIQFIEPNYDFPMEIGARGSLSLRICDSAAFVTRLIGSESSIMPETITRYFRSFIQNRVKSHLARTIKEHQLNIFEIDTQLDILSEALHSRLKADFINYGVELVQFLIEEVVRPEDDMNYINLKNLTAKRYTDIYEAQTAAQVGLIREQNQAQRTIINAQAMAEKRKLEGYTYQDERTFDVYEEAVKNEGVGQFAQMGMGLGIMAGVGGAMGGSMAGIVSGTMGGISASMPPVPPVPNVPAAPPYTTTAPATPAQPESIQPAPPESAQPVQPSSQAETGDAQTRLCDCGATVSINAKFCPECGKPQPKLCPGCGKTVSDNAKFCEECGTKL